MQGGRHTPCTMLSSLVAETLQPSKGSAMDEPHSALAKSVMVGVVKIMSTKVCQGGSRPRKTYDND